MGWTERLFDGLDFPVVHKLLAAGGCESDVLQQVGSLQAKHPDLHVFRTVQPMGESPVLGVYICIYSLIPASGPDGRNMLVKPVHETSNVI